MRLGEARRLQKPISSLSLEPHFDDSFLFSSYGVFFGGSKRGSIQAIRKMVLRKGYLYPIIKRSLFWSPLKTGFLKKTGRNRQIEAPKRGSKSIFGASEPRAERFPAGFQRFQRWFLDPPHPPRIKKKHNESGEHGGKRLGNATVFRG